MKFNLKTLFKRVDRLKSLFDLLAHHKLTIPKYENMKNIALKGKIEVKSTFKHSFLSV